MSFIKDSLNVKVFLLVVIIAVCMVSLLIVFHKNFVDINNKYDDKVKELNQTFDSLVGTQSKLNKSLSDLELKTVKEEDLKDKYSELRTSNEKLEADNKKMTDELAAKKAENEDLKEENVDLKKKREALLEKVKCLETGGQGC